MNLVDEHIRHLSAHPIDTATVRRLCIQLMSGAPPQHNQPARMPVNPVAMLYGMCTAIETMTARVIGDSDRARNDITQVLADISKVYQDQRISAKINEILSVEER